MFNEIDIKGVQNKTYKKVLFAIDKNAGNRNKKIDSIDEARSAISKFSQEHDLRESIDFISFLEQRSSYSMENLKTAIIRKKDFQVIDGIVAHISDQKNQYMIKTSEEDLGTIAGLSEISHKRFANYMVSLMKNKDLGEFSLIRSIYLCDTVVESPDIPLGLKEAMVDPFMGLITDENVSADVKTGGAWIVWRLMKSDISDKIKERSIDRMLNIYDEKGTVLQVKNCMKFALDYLAEQKLF